MKEFNSNPRYSLGLLSMLANSFSKQSNKNKASKRSRFWKINAQIRNLKHVNTIWSNFWLRREWKLVDKYFPSPISGEKA